MHYVMTSRSFFFLHLYVTGYRSLLWSSYPPLSINESSIDIFICSYSDTFSYGDSWLGIVGFSVALRETFNSSLPWTYSEVLYVNCNYDCNQLWYTNYSDSLVGSHTYSDLTPNTLYTIAALACYPPIFSCIFGRRVRFVQYSNMTTRPEGMDMQVHACILWHWKMWKCHRQICQLHECTCIILLWHQGPCMHIYFTVHIYHLKIKLKFMLSMVAPLHVWTSSPTGPCASVISVNNSE